MAKEITNTVTPMKIGAQFVERMCFREGRFLEQDLAVGTGSLPSQG